MQITSLAKVAQRTKKIFRSVALGGLIGVLTPVWFVTELVARARSSRRVGVTTEISKVRVDDIDLADLVAGDRPVIVQGLDSLIPFDHRPDLAGLRAIAAEEGATFPVKVHQGDRPYFLYVGDYGSELVRTEKMSLDQFLDHMFVSPPTDGTCTYRLFGTKTINGRIAHLIDEMATTLGALTDRTPDRNASGVWIGSAGVVTPMHHDAWTGLLFQFEGSKRVRMFAPSDRPNLHLSSPFKPTSRWSELPPRSHEADPAVFGRFERANPFVAQLDAGEALFIPPYWMHEVEALEPNVSIPFRFGTRPVDYMNPGFLRPAVEVFHSKYLAGSAAS